MPRPFVIGLTGGIASGKSTIAKRLADELGTLLECDKLGWRAYDPKDGKEGAACRDALEAAFKGDAEGGTLLAEDGTVDRRKLGPIVFSAKAKMDELNGIVWPRIAAMAEKELEEMGSRGVKVVVMEAAVLLEAGWDAWVDEVWVVSCPAAKQQARLISRNNLKPEDAAKRLASQMSLEERVGKADVVIDNGGTLTIATIQALAAIRKPRW